MYACVFRCERTLTLVRVPICLRQNILNEMTLSPLLAFVTVYVISSGLVANYCRHFSGNSASEGEISRADLIRLTLRSILSNAPTRRLLFYFRLAVRIFQSVLQIVTLKSLVLSVRLQR